MILFTEAQFNQFKTFLDENKSKKVISRSLNISTTTVLVMRQFYFIHGAEDFHKFYVEGVRQHKSKYEVACIIERMLSDNIPRTFASVLYKVSIRILENAMEERRKAGKPLLQATPAPLPDAYKAYLLGTREVGEVLGAGDILVRSFPHSAQENRAPTTKNILFGRARSPVPSGRMPKRMRSKAIEEAKKEQARLKALIDGGEHEGVNSNDEDRAKIITEISLADSVFGDFPKGIPASEFVSGLKGRPIEIDVHSEGFDDLPIEIKYKAIKNYLEKVEIRIEASKKLRALVQEKH